MDKEVVYYIDYNNVIVKGVRICTDKNKNHCVIADGILSLRTDVFDSLDKAKIALLKKIGDQIISLTKQAQSCYTLQEVT